MADEKLKKPVKVNPEVQKPEPVSTKEIVKQTNDAAALQKKLEKLELELKIKELEAKLKDNSKPVQKATAIAPNMLKDAEKTVSGYDGVSIPKTISSVEKAYYHMLCVVSEADRKTKKFTFGQRVVKLSLNAYTKHKKSYRGTSDEEWIMFHNPLLTEKK